MEYEIRVLTLEGDRCPFEEWYKDLKDSRTRARIQMRLARVQSGNLGDYKNVGKGVSELRLDFGPGYRIYFAQTGTTLIVLLGAGDKSAQERDITRAQELWEEQKDAIERYQRSFQE